jgi:flagellar M-ring protein FliF
MVETDRKAKTDMLRTAQGRSPSGDGNTSRLDNVFKFANGVRERILALPPNSRHVLFATLFCLLIAGVALTWYAGRTDWRVLFRGLEGKDLQQVSQELSASGITYRLTNDGAGLEVPSTLLDKARMEVAAKGMPQTGRLGFELFDKPNWIGSEFDEKVNYQRALEGELEHTIESLGVVESARVHLVLPQHSLFVSEDRPAKASVVLKLRRSALDQEQADSIRSLVAGAVESLSPDSVTLVDAAGRMNLRARTTSAEEEDLEQQMEAKLVSMLEPLAGRDNVRATVNISLDESNEDRTDEIYDPNQAAALTMQKTEQTSVQGARPTGIPGTASNSPVGAPPGAAQGSQVAAAPGTPPLLQRELLPVYPQQGGGTGQSVREENGTYGVTRHVLHVEEKPGRVKRITAAVVVNDRSVIEQAGKLQHVVWKQRNADEMRRLEQLAQAAVGFDDKRGDVVTVENVSFTSNAPEPAPPIVDKLLTELRKILRDQPELGKTLIIALCAMVLLLFAMKPVARQIGGILKEPMLLGSGNVHKTEANVMAVTEPEISKLEADTEAVKLELTPKKAVEALHRQGVYERVAEHIRREPSQSTRLLEAWIGSAEDV